MCARKSYISQILQQIPSSTPTRNRNKKRAEFVRYHPNTCNLSKIANVHWLLPTPPIIHYHWAICAPPKQIITFFEPHYMQYRGSYGSHCFVSTLLFFLFTIFVILSPKHFIFASTFVVVSCHVLTSRISI